VSDSSQQTAEFQRLIHAFDVFSQASETLQRSYRELQDEAHRLATDLALANTELERSLVEKESFKNYLKNILESLGNGVLVIDQQGILTICNPAAAAMLRLSADLAKTPVHFCELPIPEDLKIFLAGLLGSVDFADHDIELHHETVNGEQQWLSVSAALLNDHQNRRSGLTLVVKDITRVKELEVETQRSKQLQVMGEMAVQLAHEVRNPLGSIELFASLLGSELSEGSEHKAWADQIVTGVKFLNHIVTNMLTFTRESVPQLKNFDLRAVVIETLDFFDPILRQRAIQVSQPTEPAAGMDVWGDPEMLRQMLMNLFMNALQAMPESGQLSVRLKDEGSEWIQMNVEDTGVGISTENLTRIFDPFFTTNAKGTGLGLALVGQIVRKHGGEIRAQSEFGKGTQFVILLPRRSMAMARPESVAASS
jgi:PAS domain S-box-containing protein